MRRAWDQAAMIDFKGNGEVEGVGISLKDTENNDVSFVNMPGYQVGNTFYAKVLYLNKNVEVYVRQENEDNYTKICTGTLASGRPESGYAGFYLMADAEVTNIVVKQATPLSTEPEITTAQNVADENDTASKELTVPISAVYYEPEESEDEINAVKAAYERQKYGLFVHYVPNLTYKPDGSGAETDIDKLANDLDVEELAKEINDMGMEYVIFTAWHANQYTLYPSEVNKRWRDDRRSSEGQKTYSDRDVISDLYDALEKYDIDLYLYTHPVDGHDFSWEDRQLTGWDDCGGSSEGSHEKWNQFQNELYDELCKRYAGKIKGLWFDGMFQHTNQHWDVIIDQQRFRDTLTAYDKDMILIANVSTRRDSVNSWESMDYLCWEAASADRHDGFDLTSLNPNVKAEDGRTWPATTTQIALTARQFGWWAGPKDWNTQFSEESYFLYTVAQACASTSGGIAWADGCYPGGLAENSANGNLFEGDFYDKLKGMYAAYLEPVEESIKNTNAGKAYPLNQGEWLGKKEWGASTESADGKYVYLHVTNKPDGNQLQLGETADGTFLGGTAEILNYDGSKTEVGFEKTENGYLISLPDGVNWNDLDTIIKVERLDKIDAEYLELAVRGAEQKLQKNNIWLYSADVLQALEQAIADAKEVLASSESTEEQYQNVAAQLSEALKSFGEAANSVDFAAGENYAAGKKAEVSSSLENGDFSKDYLTDGKKIGEGNRGWTSDPARDTANGNESVTIDLEEVKKIGRIDLTPTNSNGCAFPEDFYIEISEDGQNYTKVFEKSGYQSDGTTFRAYFAAADARYVRITGTKLTSDDLTWTGYYRMQFSEIEVYPMSVEEAAYKVGEVPEIKAGTTQLTMPAMADGFTITGIASSSNEDIISLDGKVTPPEHDTDVELTFTVVRDSDGVTAITRKQTVIVKGSSDESEDPGKDPEKPDDPNKGDGNTGTTKPDDPNKGDGNTGTTKPDDPNKGDTNKGNTNTGDTKPTQTDKTVQTNKSVKTGDSVNIFGYVGWLIICGVIMSSLVVKVKKRTEK